MCCVSHVPLFVTPWTVAHQPPLFIEFSRQEYWSGLPFPSPGDLPDLGIELGLLHEPPTLTAFKISLCFWFSAVLLWFG